jgi:hypothetical protein
MPITNTEIETIIYKFGGDGNDEYVASYPFHYSIARGDMKGVEESLRALALKNTINSFDCVGFTPLTRTIYYSVTFPYKHKYKAIVFLLESGADPCLPCISPLADIMPIHIAVDELCIPFVRILIWYGPENYMAVMDTPKRTVADYMELYWDADVKKIICETYQDTLKVKKLIAEAETLAAKKDDMKAAKLFYEAAKILLAHEQKEKELPYLDHYECYREAATEFYAKKHEEYLLQALKHYEVCVQALKNAATENEADFIRQALNESNYMKVISELLDLASRLHLTEERILYADKLAKALQLLDPASFKKSYPPPVVITALPSAPEPVASPSTSESPGPTEVKEDESHRDDVTDETAPLLREATPCMTHSTLHKRLVHKGSSAPKDDRDLQLHSRHPST